MTGQTARDFLAALANVRSDEERTKYERYFPVAERRPGDEFIGVAMGRVFEIAKRFTGMPGAEIEELLESDVHEARAGAVKVMALRAGDRKATDAVRTEMHELYLRRHDRIDEWDLVDLGAPTLLGAHLRDRPRDLLDRLAASTSPWERRSALYATVAYLRHGDAEDAARLGERLAHDPHESVQKAVGTVLRGVGDVDRDRLRGILDRVAATMPRVALRYAIEKLDRSERDRYLALGRSVAR